MQIIRQQNAIKSHFSIIPYGITMSKIFSFPFKEPNDSTISSFLPLLFLSRVEWCTRTKNGNSV